MNPSISIIGFGNVGQFLYTHISKQYEVIQVFNRSAIDIDILNDDTTFIRDYKDLKKSDIYILAVADRAIAEVSARLYENSTTHRSLVIHTSGSVRMEALSPFRRKGYAWPLQSISSGHDPDIEITPFYVGASNGEDATLLDDVFSQLSTKVRLVSEHQKGSMHLAATIANNFSNLMYTISSDLCENRALQFSDLLPIISQTAEKLNDLSPREAQTGAAMRGDIPTIEDHLAIIEAWRPDLVDWYKKNSLLINPDLEI